MAICGILHSRQRTAWIHLFLIRGWRFFFPNRIAITRPCSLLIGPKRYASSTWYSTCPRPWYVDFIKVIKKYAQKYLFKTILTFCQLQIDVGLVGLDFYPNNVVPWCSSARTMATLIAVFFASIHPCQNGHYVQCALIVAIHTHTLWMVAYCHDCIAFLRGVCFINPLLCVPAIILHYWVLILVVVFLLANLAMPYI